MRIPATQARTTPVTSPATSPAPGVATAQVGDGAAAPAVGRLRVVIADADPLSRRVVRDALQAAPGMVVAAEASDGVEAAELAVHYRPDVLLAEVALRRMDGIALVRHLGEHAPGVRVVLFTVDPDDDLALRALRAGAWGVLSKDMRLDAVATALRGTVRGEAAISRRLTLQLIEQVRHIPEGFAGMRPVRSPLTPREWEVLDLVSTGITTQEIAAALVLTEDTVYSHVKNILRKLGVHTRAEAVALAERLRQPQDDEHPPGRSDAVRRFAAQASATLARKSP